MKQCTHDLVILILKETMLDFGKQKQKQGKEKLMESLEQLVSRQNIQEGQKELHQS